MRIPKRYGQSRIESCPFCNKTATSKNKGGVPTCPEHASQSLPDLRCTCGKYLEPKDGKFGPYFNCISCGNINFRKALEMNPKIEIKKPQSIKKETNTQNKDPENKKAPKEITISSKDVDVYFS